MTKRLCLCGQRLEPNEEYGPVSQLLLKWYEHGRSFGEPATRRKFFLCREHTNELVDYLDALSSGQQVTIIKELQ